MLSTVAFDTIRRYSNKWLQVAIFPTLRMQTIRHQPCQGRRYHASWVANQNTSAAFTVKAPTWNIRLLYLDGKFYIFDSIRLCWALKRLCLRGQGDVYFMEKSQLCPKLAKWNNRKIWSWVLQGRTDEETARKENPCRLAFGSYRSRRDFLGQVAGTWSSRLAY